MHDGHRTRMKNRFNTQGLSAFSQHEMLELLLYFVVPRGDVNPLAHRLLDYFGSLHHVLEADYYSLQKVEGVGPQIATLITLVYQFEKENAKSKLAIKPILSSAEQISKYCITLLSQLKEEHLYAICVDGKMAVIATVLIAKGSMREVFAHPRNVLEVALRYNAHGLLLCHNHPGGLATPSKEDITYSVHISQLLNAIEVILLDHIIVHGKVSYSMAQHGDLQ